MYYSDLATLQRQLLLMLLTVVILQCRSCLLWPTAPWHGDY